MAEHDKDAPLAGKVFVTSGLGGMSGAQPKAGKICGSIAVVAEISKAAVDKRRVLLIFICFRCVAKGSSRHSQGWVDEKLDTVDGVVERVRKARNTVRYSARILATVRGLLIRRKRL